MDAGEIRNTKAMNREIEIKVVSGVSAGDVFRFNVSSETPVLIGREQSSNIVLQDMQVSRKHAAIELEEGGEFYIFDQHSSMGTLHMGFPLTAGHEGRRKLASGDEFKIGETIFSVYFSNKFSSNEDNTDSSLNKPLVSKISASKKKFIIALLLLCLLLLLIVVTKSNKKKLVDESSKILSLPAERVLGYWSSGNDALSRDTRHPDKVNFSLPASDLLVEYDYISTSPIHVQLDGVLTEVLEAEPNFWQRRMLIVRDIMIGKGRVLTFDNVDYPAPSASGKDKGEYKKWAVRNVRVSPISRNPAISIDTQLAETANLISSVDSSAEGLFTAVRAMQSCFVSSLIEQSLDAYGLLSSYDSLEPESTQTSNELEQDTFNPEELRERLVEARKIRQKDSLSVSNQSYIKELAAIIEELDSELWRRVNMHLNAAQYDARTKDYISAYDHLMAVKRMFPEGSDYRWLLANKMFNDDKIIPKRVRLRPNKYRKETGR